MILIASLGLAGCSQSSDEPSVDAPHAAESATKDELESGLANVQKQAEDQADKLKAEVAAALANQKKALLSELNANTQNLTSQMSGIKDKYDSLKASLPDEVLIVVKEQIPDLESSIQKIKDMVAKFDPKTIEELNAIKTKYEKEYQIAQGLMAKVSKKLAGAGVNVPKLF